ncbi:sugar transferase [Arthrobacter cheniae]|uniref:Sugar transferase n=1 Tax=Arthrobacter cheniae TaxID=1258888 RepID=A0A3A5M8B7_9MICC|nr:sugar transferase [Arthrobacter cheniae]RJT81117.1 sugar transferase [Arthrobacter cheniae]
MDAAVVLWATVGALIARFGVPETERLSVSGQPYVAVSLVLAAGWWAMLSLRGSREPTVLGHGTEEYKRVVSASLILFGLVAIVSYALQLDTARGYVGVALPAGLTMLLLARMIVRCLLHIERMHGKSSLHVLVVGSTSGVRHLADSLRAHPMAGYIPAGAYLPGVEIDANTTDGLDLPIVGRAIEADEIIADIRLFGPDAVALSSSMQLAPETIRALGWALADLNIRLIMAPALTDVAGPRIHTQPVAGLPLIHVSTPNLEKGQRLVKRTTDIFGAGLLIVALSPLLALIATLVRVDSQGPVLFRQERVGTAGQNFEMFKFRSMELNAEARLELLREQHEGNDVLFKLKNDPRVTTVGRVLRKFSLDELPQLFNVLGGSMSLVGPRPPLAAEVERYDIRAHRRLLVRPGMTGLWQVSGRSLLSWDETVRLDLYYVENWSFLSDLAILLRTFKAVVSRHGAF